MNPALETARTIVCYLRNQPTFKIVHPPKQRYSHMGALVADAILQAGLNYKTVVKPRIQFIEENFSTYSHSTDFFDLCMRLGPKFVLKWNDSEKPNRLLSLLFLLIHKKVESVPELARWLHTEESNCLRNLPGIGPKTLDYLCLLAGNSKIPIDRHFKKLFNVLKIHDLSYEHCQRSLEFSADLLDVDRSVFDHSLWLFLSSLQALHSQNTPHPVYLSRA